ncbi:hypothetical protein M5689_012528 [Euphorbia peplus]|nr:hypothetical protein M5689_012528 [Euphorbia peplus]
MILELEPESVDCHHPKISHHPEPVGSLELQSTLCARFPQSGSESDLILAAIPKKENYVDDELRRPQTESREDVSSELACEMKSFFSGTDTKFI